MGIQGGWTTAAGRGVCWWCLLLALVLTAVPARAWQGRVRSVPDGDSLTVERAGRTVKVRLYGIDSPEYRQPGWREARDFTRPTAGPWPSTPWTGTPPAGWWPW